MNKLIQWPRAQYWDKPWNPWDRMLAVFTGLRQLLCGYTCPPVQDVVQAARNQAETAASGVCELRVERAERLHVQGCGNNPYPADFKGRPITWDPKITHCGQHGYRNGGAR